jgi:hypothetical protein
MPCPCEEAKKNQALIQTGNSHALFPHLDKSTNELLLATVNEVAPENIQYANQLLPLIPRLGNGPHASRPLLDKFLNNYAATNDSLNEILCKYCKASSQHFANVFFLHLLEFERYNLTSKKIHLWHSLKALVWESGKGYAWMLVAFWFRLVSPKLSFQHHGERPKW